jgi:hypothetical protein
MARSEPIRTSRTGFRESNESHAVCRVPSNAGSVSISQGSSSMTTMLGESAGSAAASWRNSAAHVGRTVPASNNSRPGRSDSPTAAANPARSAAGSAPWLAWKNTNGSPARSQNTSTSRDLPTRRRPRSSTATPGRSRRASPTLLSSASSRASSPTRPTNPPLPISLLAPKLQSTVVHRDGATSPEARSRPAGRPRKPARHVRDRPMTGARSG